ncbi:MAG: LPS assembly lipoprotein LptE [Sphingomonadaceae bacterium]
MTRAPAPLLLVALALCACGLRPLYGGASGAPVAERLGAVEVGEIPGRAGWLVHHAVKDRLAAAPDAAPRYRLDIELDDEIVGLGIRSDNAVTRERRTLRARYRLVEIGRGTVLLDATAGADAGIDVVSSEYATVAAEQSALEWLSEELAGQILARVALYLRHRAGAE